MKRKRLLFAVIATVTLTAILGGAVIFCFHTHHDGSLHDDPDCVICQLGNLLANMLAAAAFVLLLLLRLLNRKFPLSNGKEITEKFLGPCLARAPPAFF